MPPFKLTCLIVLPLFCSSTFAEATDVPATKIRVTIERGQDLGQSFGSLFQATTSDGALVIGAGFQNVYNTRYRGDRHALQFFVRSAAGERTFSATPLPRPNRICGTYLYARDDVVRSTYGGVNEWDPVDDQWQDAASIGGTEETMRVGREVMEFGASSVKYAGDVILAPPVKGSYQLFFYANGHLCFYHVHRGAGGYRAYANDEDGFSKLYACPWTPEQSTVDLSHAVVRTLPVVGETTFAWGQLGKQIVTGSNIGGFYVFDGGMWQMLLEPELGVSYQIYSTMVYRDRLLMGQYPTGHLFEYDGHAIKGLPGWPPQLPGVSGSAREAQTSVIYGGELLVGVWPWGEVWRYSPDVSEWVFVRRMFDHPQVSEQVVHPYDLENRGNAVGNQWGQRVTSLVTSGSDLFVSTSAKSPIEWDAERYPFLAPEKWKSYGTVYRMHAPGHLSAPLKWTDGPTTIEITIQGSQVSIHQDGAQRATTAIPDDFASHFGSTFEPTSVTWGDGIYGEFSGDSIEGTIQFQP